MAEQMRVASISREQTLATNKLIRNTYTLLSITLLFSAAMAAFAMTANIPPLNIFIVLGGYFGLLFLTNALRNSIWGLAGVFALTGFMGFTLGPILNLYIQALANGSQLVMMALGGTGVIFLGLSGYALSTRKDFSFMRGFLFAGILVAFIAALAAYFFSMPGLALAVSAMFMLLMCGLILYQTSEMVNGGETNYIMATITLYVAIYNLFTSLLHLLMAFFGED
ncbi:BAX inhibitor protein [Alkalilimnicola ehrlichii]|uniref:BAX inhibitor protein n=1 Tax=Alkalilimnicola ehrlichii TaxID=351052 RepID=A0A3E0WZQ0_9GAMM|nr:Bax inhibitor-1/YccA family protein [Alkalilimnicola ehrlichii]RFA28368.1 BAX inhibitor protein [Alkalilimnicola ehrlichii]RFA38567.1 BAX inhibitor protein [Alkalilimnicola ehrlichii]